ncbi:hypothetical protein B1H26_42145 [Amycolatopsis sp. BJA-103]|nr:hypothetical protein B1H26_42145 [Amycolatopsis sp. BJA-103]
MVVTAPPAVAQMAVAVAVNRGRAARRPPEKSATGSPRHCASCANTASTSARSIRPTWRPSSSTSPAATHHLFTTLISRPVLDAAHRIRCSSWRRRHQYRAQQGHYQRQSTHEP